MSRFSDILNSTLPSKRSKYAFESGDDEEFDDSSIDNQNDGTEECGDDIRDYDTEDDDNEDLDDLEVNTDDIVDNDDDSFDPDDMDEEDLADLDRELSSDSLDAIVGGNEKQISLSPDEEMRADDMMTVAATTMVVNNELSTEEKAEFLESQANIAVDEGFMTESDVNEMAEAVGLVQEQSYNKKMIVRLDAQSKMKQLYGLAVNVSAASHNDPDYRKLRKVMKMRKVLRARLKKKYHAEALKRMKVYFTRLKRSKSPILSKIGSKMGVNKK